MNLSALACNAACSMAACHECSSLEGSKPGATWHACLGGLVLEEAVSDVVGNTQVEQLRLLRHQHNTLAVVVTVDVGNVFAVH